MTKYNDMELVRMRLSGMTYAEIYARCGCSSTAVRSAMRRLGVVRPRASTHRPQEQAAAVPIDKGRVLALHKAGWSVEDIYHDILHSTREQIEQIIREAVCQC